MKVSLIFGGRSVEHEISIRSAQSIWKNLASKYSKEAVYIAKDGSWRRLGSRPSWKPSEMSRHPALKFPAGRPSEVFAKDAVLFPILHGSHGEDGTLQGMLEMMDAAYVGTGVLASALAMNKLVAKQLARHHGIRVLDSVAVRKEEWKSLGLATEKFDGFVPPLFVKPGNLGSSVGISKIKKMAQMDKALDIVFQYDDLALVERGLDKARELEVAILGSYQSPGELVVSMPGEVIPNHEFYSYEAKYLDPKGADLKIPAEVPHYLALEARKIAAQIFVAFQMEGMCRVDFLLERTSRRLYFNEANTAPGFTSISMYPKLMEASGLSFAALLDCLIEIALRRRKRLGARTVSYFAKHHG